MTQLCPHCGDPADGFVAPGKRNTVTDYDRLCSIGTAAGTALDGYRVIHT